MAIRDKDPAAHWNPKKHFFRKVDADQFQDEPGDPERLSGGVPGEGCRALGASATPGINENTEGKHQRGKVWDQVNDFFARHWMLLIVLIIH